MKSALLVTDHPRDYDTLERDLRKMGCAVWHASTSSEAVKAFLEHSPVVVLVDNALPDLNGLRTVKRLRRLRGGDQSVFYLLCLHAPWKATTSDVETELLPDDVLQGDDVIARTLEKIRALLATAVPITRELSIPAIVSARPCESSLWDDLTHPDQDADWTSNEATADERPPGWSDKTDSDSVALPESDIDGAPKPIIVNPAIAQSKALEGSFNERTFAKVLGTLAQTKQSGELVCTHPADGRQTTEGTWPTKVIRIQNGLPVHVRSNLLHECLGQRMVKQGHIDQDVLFESLRRMQRGDGLQGEILIKLGAATETEIPKQLRGQLRDKLIELFTWNRGRFVFHAQPFESDDFIALGISVEELIYQGVMHAEGPDACLEYLDVFEEAPVQRHEPHFAAFQKMPLSPTLARSLPGIDGKKTVKAILEQSRKRGMTAQLLVAMNACGAISFDSETSALLPSTKPEKSRHTREAVTAPEMTRNRGQKLPDSDRSADPLPRTASTNAALNEHVNRLLTAERHFRRGRQELSRGRFARATEAFERATKHAPEAPRFKAHLAWAQYRQSDSPNALGADTLRSIEEALREDAHNATLCVFRGQILADLGRTSEAHDAFKKALEVDPNNREASKALARLEISRQEEPPATD